MENIQSLRYKKLLLIALVVLCTKMFAQDKIDESFLVKENVIIELDATYTNVIFETWNKKKVSVVGIIEDENISKEERNRLEKEWLVEANGNGSLIQIKSKSKGHEHPISISIDIEDELSFIQPMIENIVEPIIQNLSDSPLSEDFTNNMSSLDFNYEAYKKDPKEYMQKWEKEVEKAYNKKGEKQSLKKKVIIKNGASSHKNTNMLGFPKSPFPVTLNNFDFDDEDYKEDKRAYLSKLNKKYKSNVTTKEVDKWLDEVKVWENNFEEKWEKWGEKVESSMEEWGENFGDKMEQWGEKVEKWAEKFADDFEKNEQNNHHKIIRMEKSNFNFSKKSPRTLLVKVPEEAQLILKIKYGNLDLKDLKNKSNVELKYASMKADNVSDEDSFIKADYSSVNVKNWNLGSLELKYAKNNYIENVGILNLVSSASDVVLEKISGDAIINGSFGDLEIHHIAKNFENLDIVLENTDAKLTLPKSDYSLYYNGNRSKLNYPSTEKFTEVKNGSSLIVKGNKGKSKSDKSIHITAKYSDVLLQ